VVVGLSPVKALDPGWALGAYHGRAERDQAGPGRAPGDRLYCGLRPPSGSGRNRGLSHGAPLVQAPWRRRKGFGRSRASGGKTIHWIIFRTISHLTTNIHLRVNGAGLPVKSEITPGQT
jgi:hypothetical protein